MQENVSYLENYDDTNKKSLGTTDGRVEQYALPDYRGVAG
jgi:hypothetical protein